MLTLPRGREHFQSRDNFAKTKQTYFPLVNQPMKINSWRMQICYDEFLNGYLFEVIIIWVWLRQRPTVAASHVALGRIQPFEAVVFVLLQLDSWRPCRISIRSFRLFVTLFFATYPCLLGGAGPLCLSNCLNIRYSRLFAEFPDLTKPSSRQLQAPWFVLVFGT